MSIESVSLANGVLMPKIGMGTFPLKGTVLRDTFKRGYAMGWLVIEAA